MRRKLKEKQRKFLRNKKAFILITVLCMGVGFAFLTSNLTITGNTSVSGNSWNVYFTNVQVTDDSVDATVVPTTSGTNTTSIDYTVTLDKPGDFYEFTVDAVNNGTIDAMIQSINMTSLDSDVEKYLSYTATYLDGTALAQNDILEADDSTTYKVRVEYKKNIQASDLSEESTNLTLTFGVNYVQSTIKAKKFVDLVKNSVLSDSNIDFSQHSSASNGRGLYVKNGTQQDTYPIYYYRGAVENNNAKFAGFCWKIVRTTETGGTKLIYNGLPRVTYHQYEKTNENAYTNIEKDEEYSFDSTNNNWINSSQSKETTITFSVAEAGDYNFNYNIESSQEWTEGIQATFYKDGIEIVKYDDWDWDNDNEKQGTVFLQNLTPSNVLSVEYSNYDSNSATLSFNLEKGIGQSVIGCTNTTGDNTQIGKKDYAVDNDSPAYNGYMHGHVYESENNLSVYNNSNYIFGSDFDFVDEDPNVSGDGTYTLKNTTTDMTQMNTYHYTCFNTEGTCSKLYYIYGAHYITNPYYIALEDGKGINEAWTEMASNQTNSKIKTEVDNWFNNTFMTYFTTNNKDYNNYLEDTIWCNDRRINTNDLDGNGTYTNNGWNPNGGNIRNENLFYSPYMRLRTGSPNLSCPNKNDSFTVTESETGNGALTYPVGLLTMDEAMLAGGGTYNSNNSDGNKDFYLYTHKAWWTMSPATFGLSTASGYYVSNEGFLGNPYVGNGNDDSYAYGIRPSISVKSDVKIATSGDGTATNPYEFLVD